MNSHKWVILNYKNGKFYGKVCKRCGATLLESVFVTSGKSLKEFSDEKLSDLYNIALHTTCKPHKFFRVYPKYHNEFEDWGV